MKLYQFRGIAYLWLSAQSKQSDLHTYLSYVEVYSPNNSLQGAVIVAMRSSKIQ